MTAGIDRGWLPYGYPVYRPVNYVIIQITFVNFIYIYDIYIYIYICAYTGLIDIYMIYICAYTGLIANINRWLKYQVCLVFRSLWMILVYVPFIEEWSLLSYDSFAFVQQIYTLKLELITSTWKSGVKMGISNFQVNWWMSLYLTDQLLINSGPGIDLPLSGNKLLPALMLLQIQGDTLSEIQHAKLQWIQV